MKLYSTAYIQKLNATSDGGILLHAIEVVESLDPLVVRRHVAFEREIVWQGQTYTPLDMVWSGLRLARGPALPTMTIAVPDLGGDVLEWVEETDILEHDVTLLVLHYDLLADAQAVDKLVLQIQGVDDDPAQAIAVFSLGLNMALSDLLPKEVFTKAEFPGIPDDRVRLVA